MDQPAINQSKQESSMRRVLLLFVVLPVLLYACVSTSPTTMQQAAMEETTEKLEDPKLPIDSLVTVGQLDNGLRYVIRQNQKPENRVELRLVVDAGSVLEDENQQGLAHFVEHMAFNGTKNFAKQELIDYLELIGMRFGPDLNAYTGFDETVYMLTVPTDSAEVVETAFQILEDWAHQISFEAEEIDKERGVVIEEWRLRRGAQQRMFDEQIPILLKDSRYAVRLPIGQKAVLDTFQHEDLRRFYRTWYRPDLMGFVAVGDIEPVEVEALVEKYFARIPAAESPPERTVFPVPDHEETLFAITTDPEATYNSVSIYYKRDVRPQGTVSTYRRSLIEALYHRMLNQRLHELTKLPEPPFLGAYSGQGRWLRSKEFFILGAAVQNNGFDAGLEALLIEAARVREHGFTASELAREKKEILRSIEQSYRERDKQQSSGFASEYVRHLLTDEAIPGIAKEYELYQELVPGIALEEINALASEWTSEKNRVITVEAPEQEGIAVPTEQDLLAIFAKAAQQEIAPYADEVSDEPLVAQVPSPAEIIERSEIPEIGVTWWTLSNGIRVCLKPTDFKNDEILFRSYSPGGHSLIPDADYVAASTATSVVSEGGVGPFNKIELEKKLAGKVVRVSPWISSLREGVSGSASPEDIQTMFELIYAFFTAPRQDSTAFQAYQTLMRGSIQNRSARPETAFSDTIAVTMAQYHHRARPWSLELLDEMDLATSMAVYQDRFADASDFSFFFVGNFTLEDIEPLVRTYLGGLPTTGREETWRDVGIEAPEGVIDKAVYRGIEPKSRSQMIFTGPFEYDGWKNNLALRSMTSVLEIKLREVLREDLGGTYGVWVGSSGSHYPDEEYRISISFGSDPDRVEELTQVIFEQIDSLKTVGTTDLYVDKVKEMRNRQREPDLKENSFWVGALETLDFNGVDPRLLIQYPALVDSLTVDMVQQSAQKYFNMDRYVRVVLYPEEGEESEGE
ncbi:MAG: insulinase family protein [Gemmatimonadetes bacterium]|nr:insulinase family protein [Gemmatimonadota bacterium]